MVTPRPAAPVAALVALALAASCDRGAPSSGYAPPAPAAGSAGSGAPAAGPGSDRDDNAVTRIYELLGKEKAQRPNPGPSVEAVVAKLAGTPLALPTVKQYVAMTAHARYCAGGRAGSGIHVAICEYASAADAAAGREYVTTKFAGLNESRFIRVVGATTIAITGGDAAANEATYRPILDGI